MARASRDSAFLNIPYDAQYSKLYFAFIVGLCAYGLEPRATLEVATGERRLDRIFDLMTSCHYSFHDLSRVQLDRTAHAAIQHAFRARPSTGMAKDVTEEPYVGGVRGSKTATTQVAQRFGRHGPIDPRRNTDRSFPGTQQCPDQEEIRSAAPSHEQNLSPHPGRRTAGHDLGWDEFALWCSRLQAVGRPGH
jgi:hypothetical protein